MPCAPNIEVDFEFGMLHWNGTFIPLETLSMVINPDPSKWIRFVRDDDVIRYEVAQIGDDD